MEMLDKLQDIIFEYDNYLDCWIDGQDAEDYMENFDELREKSLALIKKLKEERHP